MLLIVTPNPALDRTMVIPNLRVGQRHRAEQVIVAAGGKGLNVARVAQTLGQPLLVCAPLGGLTGQCVAHLAQQEGFECRWCWHSAGETRTCVLIVDPFACDATPLDEHGPTLSSEDWLTFADTLLDAALEAQLVTISGSLPPGVQPTDLANVVQSLEEQHCRVIVDSHGEVLRAVFKAKPFGIKVTGDELGTALSLPIHTIEEAKVALTTVRSFGISLVVVSLGAQGAVGVCDEGMCWVCPPKIAHVSTVGCGDSFLAGLATGFLRNFSLAEMLQLGVACGSADALTIGGGLVHMTDIHRILSGTTIEWIEKPQSDTGV